MTSADGLQRNRADFAFRATMFPVYILSENLEEVSIFLEDQITDHPERFLVSEMIWRRFDADAGGNSALSRSSY